MKKSKKLNWVAITGFATVGATIISAFVFLFGDGILKQNAVITPTPSQPFNNTTPIQSQATNYPTEPNLISSARLSVNQSASSRNGVSTFTLNYIELGVNTILVNITIDNSENPLNILTCGLPKLTKSQYGEVTPLKEKGVFYSRVSESCFLGIFSDVLIGMKTKQDGWLVYELDPSRFHSEGLYSLDNIGESFPTIVFEITNEP